MEEETTILAEKATKHPLQNPWKFWYFESNKEKSWEDCLRVVSPFHTVEDFWAVFNHIKGASELRTGSSYFVFKEHLKPMWEDPGNRAGGRWLISLDKRRGNVDQQWLEVLLCLIGESFDEDGDDICGAAVDIRNKMDKISVWTSDCNNKDRILNIGKRLKERLGMNFNLQYERHADTSSKTSSMAKSSFVI